MTVIPTLPQWFTSSNTDAAKIVAQDILFSPSPPPDGFASQLVGYINVCNMEFKVCIRTKKVACTSDGQQQHTLQSTKFSILCPKRLYRLLDDGGHLGVVEKRMEQHDTAESLGADFQSIVRNVVSSQSSNSDTGTILLAPLSFYQMVLRELEIVGWEKVHSIEDDLSSVTVSVSDANGRKHMLTMKIPTDYPSSEPRCLVDLPEPFVPPSVEVAGSEYKEGGLHRIILAFEHELGKYQVLWEVLDDLDNRVWVIEPATKTRSSLYRRIVISPCCSLRLQVTSAAPKSVCDCRFLGADREASKLRTTFNQNVRRWDPNLMVFENLQRVLGISFPSASSIEASEQHLECGICYGYQLPRKAEDNTRLSSSDEFDLPDEVCNNTKCGRPFHLSCLVEWLRALPSTRTSFDTLFGSCPYCSSPIQVKAS